MSDYIDRKALLEKIKKSHCIGNSCNSYNGVRCRSCEINDAINDIEDAPSADVAPIVYAEWTHDHATDEPRCSECGKDAINGEITPYCPHCRAMMSGGESDG